MIPFDPGALFARARASKDDADAVIAELGRFVASSPDDFDAWLTLGLVCAEDERADRAEEALARALALRPSSLLARIAHARLMPPNVARRELEAAHAIAPEHLGILFELVYVESRLHRFDDALRHLRAARALAQSDADRARVAFALAPVALACAKVERLLDASPVSLVAWSTFVAPDDSHGPIDVSLPSNDRLVRADGALLLATFDPSGADTERAMAALFAFVPRAIAVAAAAEDAPAANAIPLVAFVAAALGIDAGAASAIVRRLGDEGAVDEGNARIAFATRDVPQLGEAHGIAIARLPL